MALTKRLLAAFALLAFSLPAAPSAVSDPEGFPYQPGSALWQVNGAAQQASNGHRHPVMVSREAATAAAATGQLSVELPDGNQFVIHHVDDYDSDSGDWTFVGRVFTMLGPQSAVITFGREGVYGAVPTPSGEILQLQSGAGGSAWIEPIDDLLPPGHAAKSAGHDFPHDHSQCVVVPPLASKQVGVDLISDDKASALAKSSTTVIDVLGIYTGGIVAERGSVSAAETYFNALVALANQAFLDSGIDARYRVVGLRQVPERPGIRNSILLSDLQANRLAGLDVRAERDALQADLVAMLRSYQSGDPTCGIAYLGGAGLNASTPNADFAHSVNSCGGYVLAHELGHNLGSMHDIETTNGTGIGAGGFGAYRYSFGYRRNGVFSTIMAYTQGGERLGRFSDPSSSQCMGGACGVEDVADNARSLRLMAPRIAAYRGAQGLHMQDVVVQEGDTGEATVWVPILTQRVAPAGGIVVNWALEDGTAVVGWDYPAQSGRATIPAGSTFIQIPVRVSGDLLVEQEETLRVRLLSATGAPIVDGEAVIRIRNDDPKGRLSGSVQFAAGATPPTQSFGVSVAGTTVEGGGFSTAVTVSPPSFAFSLDAPIGAALTLTAQPPSPFLAAIPTRVTVTESTLVTLPVPRHRQLQGRLVFASGDAPTAAVNVEVRHSVAGSTAAMFRTFSAPPPGFLFADVVPDGAWVQVSVGRPGSPSTAVPQVAVLGVVASDLGFDVAMSSQPTVSLSWWSGELTEGQTACATANLTTASTVPVAVPVSLVSGTAGVPADVGLLVGGAPVPTQQFELTIAAGATASQQFCLAAVADGVAETPETAVLRLGTPTNAALAAGAAERSITLRDPPPPAPIRVRLSDASVSEGDAQGGTALVQVTLSSPAPAGGLRVRLATVDGTAIAGTDYVARSVLLDLPPLTSTAVVEIPLVGDAVSEPDETFVVRASDVGASVPVQIEDGESIVIVRNDDLLPSLRLLDASVAEGDAGTTPVRLQAVLSYPAPGPVSLTLTTSAGTASAGSDYVHRSASLSIPAGASRVDLVIDVIGDIAVESNETFTVLASGVAGATVDDGSAAVTISNDDATNTLNLRISDAEIIEGASGRTAMAFSYTLSAPVTAANASFDVRTVDGSAQAGTDFDALVQTVPLALGVTSGTIVVQVVGDGVNEPDEGFELSISNPRGVIFRGSNPRGVIRNDDGVAVLPRFVGPGEVRVTEGDAGPVVARVVWSLPAPAPTGGVELDVQTVDGSARAGTDYTAVPRTTLRIEAGQNEAALEVQVLGDTAVELDEVLSVVVIAARGALPPESATSIRILENEPRNRLLGRLVPEPGLVLPDQVTLRVNDASATSSRTFNVFPPDYSYELIVAHTSPVVLELSSVLPAPAYVDSRRVTVGVVSGDVVRNIDVRRGHTLSGRAIIPEGITAPSQFWVGARNPATGEEEFFLATAPNFSYRIPLRPGIRTCLFADVAQPLFSPCIDLGVVSGDVARDLPLSATRMPSLSLEDVMVNEGNAGNLVATVVVRLSSSAPAGGVSVDLATSDGGAIAGSDYVQRAATVSIAEGASVGSFDVEVIGDTVNESDETFFVNVRSALSATVADGSAIVTIRNDDVVGPPQLTVSDVSVAEGAATTTTNASVRISLSGPAPAGGVSVSIRTLDGSAQSPSDYVGRTSTFSIPQGGRAADFLIQVNGDDAVEPDETFTVQVTSAGNAVLQDPVGIVTIRNDDTSAAVLVARRDRAVVAENSTGIVIAVLVNDVYEAARLAGGSMAITSAPGSGTAAIVTQGTADPSDDAVSFVPPRDWSGSTSLRYRLCEGGGRCTEATLDLVVRPQPGDTSTIELGVSTHSGFRDLSIQGLRALPGLRFTPTPLVAPLVDAVALGVDATTESPWDSARAGSATTLGTLPGTASPVNYRLMIEAVGASDVDLYVGMDRNLDGLPSEDEIVCASAMAGIERCEVAVATTTTTTRYWTMVHNRVAATQQATLRRFEVPMVDADGTLTVTAPGRLAEGERFALRAAWDDPTLLPGDSRVGWIRMSVGGVDIAELPFVLRRSAVSEAPMVLDGGVERTLRLPAGGSHERLFVDVPAGASELRVTTRSSSDVDLYLARVDIPASTANVPLVPAGPARADALASAATPSGDEIVVITNPPMGRWYVAPVNRAASAATVAVRATVVGAAPLIRPGAFFPPGRSGHGLFLHPAGGVWVAIWYTYLQDGTPTWYYMQAAPPGSEGKWTSPIFRSTWSGTSGFLTSVGRANFTATAQDRFTFTYTLDGETGSETFESLGRGCPSIAGRVRDASQHYFDPARSGAGYSNQFFSATNGYEFFASFVYDGRGVPRFLVAEAVPQQALQSSIGLDQLRGACPLCVRSGSPTRSRVGNLVRVFGSEGPLMQIQQNATFVDGVPGTWQVVDNVIMLDGQNRTPGCAP